VWAAWSRAKSGAQQCLMRESFSNRSDENSDTVGQRKMVACNAASRLCGVSDRCLTWMLYVENSLK
jgi:hypothetical protein